MTFGTPAAWVAVVGLTAVVFGGLGFAWLRHRAFRRLVHYDPARSQHYALERFGGKGLVLSCSRDGFAVPEERIEGSAAFLPLRVEATFLGRFIDPHIETVVGEVSRRQYFERGCRGTRYLNLSALFNGVTPVTGRICLRGRHVTWREQQTKLFSFGRGLVPSDKVVVVAPHPDDAEIAAFGLYAARSAVVVTVSAGEASDRFMHVMSNGQSVGRSTVARMRVWDSIVVPRLGGVAEENAVNLAYPDNRLCEMFADPNREFAVDVDGIDFGALRAMNCSKLVSQAGTPCTWRSLVTDLARIIRETRPQAIIAPFLSHDSHPDHGYTTVAVWEAMLESGVQDLQILLYLVHNRWSELYPFGPAGSDVSLPPMFEEDELECDGVYVAQLSAQQQEAKFLALEAMHDVREIPELPAVSWRTALRKSRTYIHAAIHGMGLPPTSFLRRGVRPQELFFLVRSDRLGHLVEQFTRSAMSSRGGAG